MQAFDAEQCREPRFKALLPFFVFIFFYVGLSVWARDFYKVPMIAAFGVASASALALDRRRKLSDKVEIFARGMGEPNIMMMCLIFILAGAFAATARGMGAVDAAVSLSQSLIPGRFMLIGMFMVSCFISLAIGTSCGTIAALTPIAAGLAVPLGLEPALLLGSIVGGAMFGDNMSMISDTTIAATRTQNVAMRDKFIMNLRIALPAFALTLLLYICSGTAAATAGTPFPPWSSLVTVAPYLMILVCAVCGLNVMSLLFFGTVLAIGIGLMLRSFDLWVALGLVGRGALDMSETLIVAILAGGLLKVIRYNGGVSYLMQRIERRISGVRGCEIGIVFLVSVINLFTANNTVAIVIAGPIARDLSDKFRCDPRRIASLLDTASCVVQGVIPYGAQILIAVGLAQSSGMAVTSLGLMKSLYYPLILALVLLASVLFGRVAVRSGIKPELNRKGR